MPESQSLEPVNYLDYVKDLIRISHETQVLSTNVLQLKPPINSMQQDLVRQEIRKRKQVMAGLDTEISELEKLLEENP